MAYGNKKGVTLMSGSFCCSSGYGVIYKYVLIFSFIYEWQSVGGYGIPAIPTLP